MTRTSIVNENNSLVSSLDELEVEFSELESDFLEKRLEIGRLNSLIDNLSRSYGSLNEYIKMGNKVIRLGQKNKDVMNIIGFPLKIEESINDGSSVDYLKGIKEQIYRYDSYTLLFRENYTSKDMELVYIKILGPSPNTLFDIGIGSSISELKESYPSSHMLDESNGSMSVVAYEHSAFVTFSIIDDTVTAIDIYYDLP